MFGLTWLKLLVVTCCVLLLPAQVLANIGKVIGVKQGAKITRAGHSQPLRAGMEVASGDSISTDGSGLVQLVFVDETKIAIGPNARMTLDVTMLRGNRKAKSFAVQALGGSFRFISGKSKKRAYSIQTPTATMAVRGTTFDLWVAPGTQSAMLVLQGRVEMCGQSGNCRETGRQCSLYATTNSGNIGRPVDQESYEKALNDGFPFVRSQEQLLIPLQVEFAGCGDDALPPQRSEARPSNPSQPEKREVEREVKSATAEARSESPSRSARNSTGSGNGGNIGGRTGSGNGNGGDVGSNGGGGNGSGGNVGSNTGSGSGRGGSIGGGSGNGGPGSGGTIGGGGSGGVGGSGVGSGDASGNGGNGG